eukprot:542729-Rhodomonas_salina.1
MSGTHVQNNTTRPPSVLQTCYPMSGTDIGCAATRRGESYLPTPMRVPTYLPLTYRPWTPRNQIPESILDRQTHARKRVLGTKIVRGYPKPYNFPPGMQLPLPPKTCLRDASVR